MVVVWTGEARPCDRKRPAVNAEPPRIRTTTTTEHDYIVRVSGDLGWPFATTLSDACQFDTPEQARRIVVDLAKVTFLDSTGLAALVRCRQEADRRGIGFAVVHPTYLCRRLIEVAGLSDMLQTTG